MIPPGAAANLLKEAGEDYIVDYQNVEWAIEAIVKIAKRPECDDLQTDPDPFVLERLNRRNQAQHLARLLDETVR